MPEQIKKMASFVNKTGNEFYSKLSLEEKNLLQKAISSIGWCTYLPTNIYEGEWKFIFSRLANWDKVYSPVYGFPYREESESMRELAKKILSDYNLFNSFKDYANHQLYLHLKESIK